MRANRERLTVDTIPGLSYGRPMLPRASFGALRRSSSVSAQRGRFRSNSNGVQEMRVKVYHNGDDVFVAWKADDFIPDCRGFALLRRRNGVEEVVSTWVGFEGDEH